MDLRDSDDSAIPPSPLATAGMVVLWMTIVIAGMRGEMLSAGSKVPRPPNQSAGVAAAIDPSDSRLAAVPFLAPTTHPSAQSPPTPNQTLTMRL